MARFGGRGRESSEREDEGRSSYGGRRGGGGGRRSYGRGRDKDEGPQFTRLGSLTLTKKHKNMAGDLRDEDIQLIWKVFLPEGTKSVTLKNGDRVFIQVGKVHRKSPSFVVGNVSLPPDDGGEGRSSRDSDESED